MRKHQDMSSTKSNDFELLPPNKKLCTDSHDLSGQTCTCSPVPSNDFQSSQSSTHLKPVEVVAKFLRALYGRSKLPAYGKWPPSPSKQFINMAVIRKKKVSRASANKFTKATLRGTHDDILHTKKEFDFEHLAETENGETAQLILVEGAPGIGKSTFAWEACKRWGVGEILQQYKLMVLLRLREKRVQQAKTIADLFYFNCDSDMKNRAIEEIESTHGAGILIILEGFDELPADLRKKDYLFMQIIKGENLCDSTILVTSRHWASRPLLANDELHRPLSQHIEIIGFTRQDIEEYLKCMTSDDDPSLLQGLNEYLSCYPNIFSLMYVPLNCAIVLEVYRESRSDGHHDQLVPKTMTELYSSLVRTLLIRYLNDHPEYRNEYTKLVSFSDLPDSVYMQFCEVAKIAYEGICNDEQLIFSDLPDRFESLGLMQCVPELYVDQGTVVSYNFLHLTLQEFMAAFHVSIMTSDMQIEHFSSVENTSMLLAFTAGLTKLNYEEEKLVIFRRFTIDGINKMSFLHWLFESQNTTLLQDLCNDSIQVNNAVFDIGSRGKFEYYVLGYCVSQSNSKWDIFLEHTDEEIIRMFVRGACTANNQEENCGKIISLGIYVHCTIPTSLKNLPTCLLSELVALSIKGGYFGWNNIVNIVQRSPQLHELLLWNCCFASESKCAVELYEALSSLNSFTTLEIYNECDNDPECFGQTFGGDSEDCEALGILLSKSQSLTELNFIVQPSTNILILNGSKIFDGIKHNENTSLQSLRIQPSFEGLSLESVESLSSLLKTNS